MYNAVEEYCKNSNAFLELDAQFTVMEAALKGYIRWADSITNNPSASQTNVWLPYLDFTLPSITYFKLTTISLRISITAIETSWSNGLRHGVNEFLI